MNKNMNLINISTFGDYYIEKYLNDYDIKILLENWWEATIFLFSHIFYQGRKDVISERVKERAIDIFKNYFSDEKRNTAFKKMEKDDFKEVRKELLNVIGPQKVGKTRDIDMTIDCLKFIGKLPDKNIVKYSKKEVENRNLYNHYNELLKLIQIGPKIASFYLRDVVMLFNLDNILNNVDYKILQPIDTWVKRIAKEFNIITGNENDNEIREKIINICLKNNVSPLKYNAGTWYVGSHSFDIVMENIDKICYRQSQ